MVFVRVGRDAAAAWDDPSPGTFQVEDKTRPSGLPGSGEGSRVSRAELIPKKQGTITQRNITHRLVETEATWKCFTTRDAIE